MTEYLDPNTWVLHNTYAQMGEHWIKVPAGAEIAAHFKNKEQNSELCYFYKQAWLDLKLFEDGNWVNSGFAMIDDLEMFSMADIVWRRDPPKETPNDIIKTAEDYRQCQSVGSGGVLYHYAASVNTARGTIHYDGVINRTDRVTGIDSYLDLRAEIAKDANAVPEHVNVHSLTVIG